MYFAMSAQVCVISGESGAGKTESAKLFLKQVISLSNGCETPGLQERIIAVNPILEAFGNAQTIMNDNSSRFGKYLDLRFNTQNAVKGGEHLLNSALCFHGG
jgi:myosin III